MIDQIYTGENFSVPLDKEVLAKTLDGLALDGLTFDVDGDILEISSDQADRDLSYQLIQCLTLGLDEAQAVALQVFYARITLAKAIQFKEAFEAQRH